MRLYYYPGNASLTPHMLLEEIGAPFELTRVDRVNGAHKSSEYLRLNPNGQIPVLVDGDLVLYETAAICLHLADTNPAAGLAPQLASAERAHYYKWLVWCTNTLQAMLMHYFYGDRMVNDGDAAAALQLTRRSPHRRNARSAGCATRRAWSRLAARPDVQRGRSIRADALPLDPRHGASCAQPPASRTLSAARARTAGGAACVRDRKARAAAGLRPVSEVQFRRHPVGRRAIVARE